MNLLHSVNICLEYLMSVLRAPDEVFRFLLRGVAQPRDGVMSDFRDILGLAKPEPGAAPARKQKLSIVKPEGMSREVFALLNQDGKGIPGAPPLVPTPSPKEAFKEKLGRVIGWEWKGFVNAARSDGLELSHWKKNNDRSTSYSFARFNKARHGSGAREAEEREWCGWRSDCASEDGGLNRSIAHSHRSLSFH